MIITAVRQLRPFPREDNSQPEMVYPGTVMDVPDEQAQHFVNAGAAKLGDISQKLKAEADARKNR